MVNYLGQGAFLINHPESIENPSVELCFARLDDDLLSLRPGLASIVRCLDGLIGRWWVWPLLQQVTIPSTQERDTK